MVVLFWTAPLADPPSRSLQRASCDTDTKATDFALFEAMKYIQNATFDSYPGSCCTNFGQKECRNLPTCDIQLRHTQTNGFPVTCCKVIAVCNPQVLLGISKIQSVTKCFAIKHARNKYAVSVCSRYKHKLCPAPSSLVANTKIYEALALHTRPKECMTLRTVARSSYCL